MMILKIIAFILSFHLVPVGAISFSPFEIQDEAGVIWHSSPGQSTLEGAMISQGHCGQQNNIRHGSKQ